jgi:uncharacterized protein YjbI with pentapeptide repeats
MIYRIQAQDRLGRTVTHEVEVGDRHIDLFAPDLRGVDLTNAWLCGADLSGANLEGAVLLGADLTEACLQRANLKNADLRYCCFMKADLRETNLEGAQMYPAETIEAKFYGAEFSANDDAAEYARIAQEEMCRRMGINPGSVAYRKLQRINGWTGEFRDSSPSPDIRPARRARCFVESL